MSVNTKQILTNHKDHEDNILQNSRFETMIMFSSHKYMYKLTITNVEIKYNFSNTLSSTKSRLVRNSHQ